MLQSSVESGHLTLIVRTIPQGYSPFNTREEGTSEGETCTTGARVGGGGTIGEDDNRLRGGVASEGGHRAFTATGRRAVYREESHGALCDAVGMLSGRERGAERERKGAFLPNGSIEHKSEEGVLGRDGGAA